MDRMLHDMLPATSLRLPVLVTALWVGLGICPAKAQSPHDTAAAVYEIDEHIIDWSPVKGVVIESHRLIRVNRTAGIEAGHIRIWDTFFQKLKAFYGEVRDTRGHVLFTVGLADVRAVAPFSEFRLFSGDIVRAVDLVAAQMPFVIDVRWTVEIENAFFWPDWAFEDAWPRRLAHYEIRSPVDEAVRWREAANGIVRTEEQQARRDIIRWEVKDWAPLDTDVELMGGYPLVHVAPEEFRVGRLRGRTDSWDALGRWYWSLTKGQIKLRSDQAYLVERQVREKVGDRARAAALKDWISDDWRYVAIEVGLGGWKPTSARQVFDNHYGDCKDAVFLWIAMMRQIGLEAYPALVRARNPRPIDPGFPKDWFDHVIGVAVISGDTLWADLSDSRYPLGTLPRSCESRWALVVGDFGGQLLWTPNLGADQSRLITNVIGEVNPQGDLSIAARVFASGHFARQLPLEGRLDPQVAAAVILGVARTSNNAWLDSITVVSGEAIIAHLHGTIRGWALASPRQLVIRPRTAGWVPDDTIGGRADPTLVEFAQDLYDTLVIRLPSGWFPGFWPEPLSQQMQDGEFVQSRQFTDGVLRVSRYLRWNSAGREAQDRRASAQLRSLYLNAGNAEWLFRRMGDSTESESP